jgi:signal transduction histidine kinase
MLKFFQPPVFEDEYKSYQALILHAASMLLSIGALFLVVYSFIYHNTFPLYLFMALFLLGWQAILMFLNYKKRSRLGAWLYLIIGWLMLTIIVIREGGISSPNYSFYFCYITIAGVLIDWRAGIILGLISIVTGLILLVTKANHLLPNSFVRPDENSIFITYSLIIIIIVSLQSVASYTVFKSLRNARSENEQREKTEHLLKLQNEEFLSLNKELSDSYQQLREFTRELEIAKAKAEESDQLKSAFLANMSHEIRTPMNAIVGFSQLMDVSEVTDEKRKQYINIINRKANDLLTIINDIFDISKLETHQIRLFYEAGNVNTLLDEVYQAFTDTEEFSEQKDIELRIGKRAAFAESEIIGDFKRIKQILVNLVGNAIKFTKQGYVEFGCTILNKSSVQFYINDTGIGIPEEQQKFIFDRFRQVEENHLSKTHGGTGLGLSISKGLAELMNGEIRVESKLNSGSTFFFSFPYEQAGSQPKSESKYLASNYFWKGKKILIVEDDKFNMEYFKKALSHTLADLYFAKTGEEARNLFKREDFNIILMDIRLPDTNGYELSSEFVLMKPAIKIIAQTAYAGEDDYQKAIEFGCAKVITKPIQLGILLQLIDSLF